MDTSTDQPATVLSTNREGTIFTVLFVDDEINILKSLKRLFRQSGYQLLFADSVSNAIKLINQHQVDLVLSDMKMPDITGAKLMHFIAQKHPHIYRIILTGFSDLASTIDAINHGKVHRFLQKPWNNDEIKLAVEEGIEQVGLKKENHRLANVVKKQNQLLTHLNDNLEEKVSLRTKQTQLALMQIQRNNSSIHKMLFNFISINPKLDGSLALNISYTCRKMASALHLPEQEVNDISLAGLLSEIGLLGVDPLLVGTPLSELNYNQTKEVLGQVHVARSILGPATHLQDVIELIANQYEHYDGNGFPNKRAEESIPIGARVIAIARDYWRYLSGKIQTRALNNKATLSEMKKHRGTVYDANIFDMFCKDEKMVAQQSIEKPIATTDLKPGMKLKCNIVNEKHILVLPEGHEFTQETIAKLINYEKSKELTLSLSVEESAGEHQQETAE